MGKEDRYNYVFDQYDGDKFIYDSKLDNRIEDLRECADILNGKEEQIDALHKEIKRECEEHRKFCKVADKKVKDLETQLKDRKCCQTCVSRFICPTYRENECCMGYNDEQVFGSLLKMMFGGMANEHIDSMLEKVKIIQGRKK